MFSGSFQNIFLPSPISTRPVWGQNEAGELVGDGEWRPSSVNMQAEGRCEERLSLKMLLIIPDRERVFA